MLATLEHLGVVPSFSRPRVSNDNPYAESLFRTCKYRPNYPRKKHGGLKFVTPAQRHEGKAEGILQQRAQVYQAAKERRPERWSGATRNWSLKNEVWLNPERDVSEILKEAA
jgi:putative transposase